MGNLQSATGGPETNSTPSVADETGIATSTTDEKKPEADATDEEENPTQPEVWRDGLKKGKGSLPNVVSVNEAVEKESQEYPITSLGTASIDHGVVREAREKDEPYLEADGPVPAQEAPMKEDDVPKYEPQPSSSAPLDLASFIAAANGSTADGTMPVTAKGGGRGGVIVALVFGGAALSIAIGASWIALNTKQDLKEVETRLSEAPVVESTQAFPGVKTLQGRVDGLRSKLEELTRAVSERPAGAPVPDGQALEKMEIRLSALETRFADSNPNTAVAEHSAPTARGEGPNGRVPANEVTSPQLGSQLKRTKTTKKDGRWAVYLSSSIEKKRAEAQLSNARAKGMKAELTSAQVRGKKRYRVTIAGFDSLTEARIFAKDRAAKAGYHGAWIGKRK